MSITRIISKAASIVAAVVIAAGISACSADLSTAAPAECPAYDGVMLIVAVHQGASAPDLTTDVVCRVTSTIAAGKPVGVIALDGAPRVVIAPTVFPISGSNDARRTALVARARGTLISAIHGLSAKSDGSDLLAALILASAAARTATVPIHDVVALDSGISDRGVDFTATGMTTAGASTIADRALATGNVTPKTFADQRYALVGFGYSVKPQSDLAEVQKIAIRNDWAEIIRRGGGIADSVPVPRVGAGPKTKFVSGKVAPLPAPDWTQPVVLQESDVRFALGSDSYTDGPAVTKALTAIAQQIIAGGQVITITGTASRNGATSNTADLDLGRRRATQVENSLLALKVPQALLRVASVGHDWCGFTPETTPGSDAANRTIVLTGPNAGLC